MSPLIKFPRQNLSGLFNSNRVLQFEEDRTGFGAGEEGAAREENLSAF
jgi:hypothetical protein